MAELSVNRQLFVGPSPANQAPVLIPGALSRAGGGGGAEWGNGSPRHTPSLWGYALGT